MKQLNPKNIEVVDSQENKRILSHYLDEKEINELLKKE